MKQLLAKMPPSSRICRILGRWALKTFIFGLLTAFVLNPNLKVAFKQIHHTLQPESLIQSDFASLSWINHQIDDLLAKDAGRQPEIRIVERFVRKNVRYVSDYQNWSNVEYWPTAEEVWSRRQEDCDGRAILAASILRSRGYPSARLVVGLQHMWITVNQNDKETSKPEKIVALLNPEPKLRLEIGPKPRAAHFLRLARALVQPTAFRDTGAGIIADIPTVRKVILALLLVFLWFMPVSGPSRFWPSKARARLVSL